MTIEKLVVKEFTVHEESGQMDVGEKYSVFVDPYDNKVYRPIEGFEVTGEKLMELFVEVEKDEDE